MKIKYTFGLAMISAVVLLALAPGSIFVAASRISGSPSSVTIDEGVSQTVSISLDEPIICAGMGTCQVSLSFTSSDSRISTSPLPLLFAAGEWNTPKTLTISVSNDNLATGNKSTSVSATAVSGSEYYNGYVVTIPLTITDVGVPTANSAPAATPASTPTQTKKTTTSSKPSTTTNTQSPVASTPDKDSSSIPKDNQEVISQAAYERDGTAKSSRAKLWVAVIFLLLMIVPLVWLYLKYFKSNPRRTKVRRRRRK
jgi:hypothetical protein